ncbi:unnamed protein product [Echinostoma caproni]|uniref:Uncharacterized protein n=1 Tax=Echinostoma caproni TaxID=27848 RepID=A0A183A1C2_9TREM|nr:unnamed protein product [Echinostoma caproni]
MPPVESPRRVSDEKDGDAPDDNKSAEQNSDDVVSPTTCAQKPSNGSGDVPCDDTDDDMMKHWNNFCETYAYPFSSYGECPGAYPGFDPYGYGYYGYDYYGNAAAAAAAAGYGESRSVQCPVFLFVRNIYFATTRILYALVVINSEN